MIFQGGGGGGGPVVLPPPLSGSAHEIRLHEGINLTGFPGIPFSKNWLTYIFYLHNFVTFIRPEKLNSDIKSFMIRLLILCWLVRFFIKIKIKISLI